MGMMDRAVASPYVQNKTNNSIVEAKLFIEVDNFGSEDPIQSMQRSIDQWRSSKVLDCRNILHEDIASFVKSVRSVDVNVF